MSISDLLGKLWNHVSEYKLYYGGAVCYAAGSYHVLGKVVKVILSHVK